MMIVLSEVVYGTEVTNNKRYGSVSLRQNMDRKPP